MAENAYRNLPHKRAKHARKREAEIVPEDVTEAERPSQPYDPDDPEERADLAERGLVDGFRFPTGGGWDGPDD